MNQRGTIFGFTLNFLIILLFLIPFCIAFMSDYNQIGNSKQIIDREFKRAISVAMIEYIDDNNSSDRIATITPEKKDLFTSKVKSLFIQNTNQYKISINLTSFDLQINDKIYFRYDGFFDYITTVGEINFPIHIKGRSKAQRFDI